MELTADLRTRRDEARRFAMERVLPVADRLDRRAEDIPDELIAELAEGGYLGLTVPQRYGGSGLGMRGYGLVVEELARAWMSVASVVGRANAILDDHLDGEAQRQRYLPRIAAGELIGAFALSEERAGSDVANLQCRAERTADGWVVHGDKKWCGFAERADFILLYARTDEPPADRPHLGISAFVVEKERGSLPPDTTGVPVDKIGYHGLTTWSLTFDGLQLPDDALVGTPGEAFYGIMEGLARKRVYTAARAVGVARGALEDALAYSQERRQFDQELADFQVIRHRLADMATEVEAARALTWQAAQALDEGHDVSRQAAMAKLFATEMAERVTSEALQIHGGNGYTYEYAVQRHWRDARLTRIFEGTSEIQRRIIADSLIEDGLLDG